MLFTMKGKSKDDPSVKIAISAIMENPLESLISVTNGIFSEKYVNKIVKAANR
jgi:beta-glucosidase